MLDIWEPSSHAHSDMRTDRGIALELTSSVVRLCREVEQFRDLVAGTVMSLCDQATDEW